MAQVGRRASWGEWPLLTDCVEKVGGHVLLAISGRAGLGDAAMIQDVCRD